MKILSLNVNLSCVENKIHKQLLMKVGEFVTERTIYSVMTDEELVPYRTHAEKLKIIFSEYDVICLQECMEQWQEILTDICKDIFPHMYSPKILNVPGDHCVMCDRNMCPYRTFGWGNVFDGHISADVCVLSRIEFQDTLCVELPREGIMAHGVNTSIGVKVMGIWIFTCHFSSTYTDGLKYVRILDSTDMEYLQRRQMVAIYDEIRTKERWIMIGDTNVGITDYNYGYLETLFGTNLQTQFTYSCVDPYLCLDHVFSNLDNLSYPIVHDMIHVSDHNGVSVDVTG